MHFEIVAPAKVPQGEPVPVNLRLTNTTDRPITVYLQGRPPAFDIVVKNESGAVVWRRLEGQTIPAILGVHTLEPGRVLEFSDTWNQRTLGGAPVPPGRYTVTGALLTDEPVPLTTPPKPIRVIARPR
jgi:hypothetical protein